MSVPSISSSFFSGGVISNDETKKFAKDQFALKADDGCLVEVDRVQFGLPTSVKVDLKRLGQLTINQKLVYDTTPKKVLFWDVKPLVPSESTICQRIYDACDKNFGEIIQYTNLMQQNANHLAHSVVYNHHGLVETRGLAMISKATSVDIDKKNFAVSSELLVKTFSYEDVEDASQCTYMKMKTVTSGTRTDLEYKKTDNIETKVYYTKDYKTEDEARTANYPVENSKEEKV